MGAGFYAPFFALEARHGLPPHTRARTHTQTREGGTVACNSPARGSSDVARAARRVSCLAPLRRAPAPPGPPPQHSTPCSACPPPAASTLLDACGGAPGARQQRACERACGGQVVGRAGVQALGAAAAHTHVQRRVRVRCSASEGVTRLAHERQPLRCGVVMMCGWPASPRPAWGPAELAAYTRWCAAPARRQWITAVQVQAEEGWCARTWAAGKKVVECGARQRDPLRAQPATPCAHMVSGR